MNQKTFKLWNRIVAFVVFAIATATYLLTLEPTASFWDCGEFIASSYKLEVGHPPGNPVFQLIARFFAMFATDPQHVAVVVNAMSGICSSLTIFFLYLTIVFFAKRAVPADNEGEYSLGQAIAIFGSGAVGALAFCFSDTFWFSAVEGEVYAMSSLFTAMVYWAMTKWYEKADEPYSNRWIILISFLMGLSIGVHLLNLLVLPCIVFLFYFKKREKGEYKFKDYVKILALSGVILGVLVFGIIPYLPKLAAYTDLLFVNVFGLPINSGAAFFLVAVLTLCFVGLDILYKKGKVFWTTALLCFTTIMIGFSLFSIVIIRSSVKTPTNENQPDNAFSLVRYLSRDQYGSAPLIYGPYFGAPYESIKKSKYWTRLGDKYVHVDGPIDVVYGSGGKMLFPRMWSNQSDRYVKYYQQYMNGRGVPVAGASAPKPTFFTNLQFFFGFQVNWMYWRYFMWNFVGRQNDIHSPSPGERMYGNWESGVKPVDDFFLGDQSDAPDILSHNKGKNHYFFLPLLLGLIGLLFQCGKDGRGGWLTALLFFMTGIAIVLYLNQTPYQVRERDYAYAGSFYAFAIWIGFSVLALYELLSARFKPQAKTAVATVVSVLCLCVPALMAQQNWDDHDRSNRRTSVEMAKNYLNSVGKDGILVTHGDNDTFPLWYAQEVEGVRTDVRIANTSLLGTDWYIDQMRYAINDSKPLSLEVGQEQYLYGTNDYIRVHDLFNGKTVPISEVMAVFRHPEAKLPLEDGSKVDFIPAKHISIPVNKENVLKYGILTQHFADSIPSEMVIEITKDYLSKPELFLLDLLSTYNWDRPINMLSMGGDLDIGLKDYLMYQGFSSKLVPIKTHVTSSDIGVVDVDELYNQLKNTYSWDALKRTDYFVDYQNLYTFLGVLPQRDIFVNIAKKLNKEGQKEKAIEVLDLCQESVPGNVYPWSSIAAGFYRNDLSVIDMVQNYYQAGDFAKGNELAKRYWNELIKTITFFYNNYDDSKSDLEMSYNCASYLLSVVKGYDQKEVLDMIEAQLKTVLE